MQVTAVKAFVRVRVELSFGAVGGSEPTSWFSLNYHTLPSFTEQIANYGNWAASTAWLPETFPGVEELACEYIITFDHQCF